MVAFSLKRKITLAGAVIVYVIISAFVLYLGSFTSYIKLLLSLSPVVFGVIQLVAAAALAAIIMELLRILVSSAKDWSEIKHFALVMVVGVSLF